MNKKLLTIWGIVALSVGCLSTISRDIPTEAPVIDTLGVDGDSSLIQEKTNQPAPFIDATLPPASDESTVSGVIELRQLPSECSVGLSTAECKKRTEKTAEEMREEAYDKLTDKLFPNTQDSKKGRVRLKEGGLEWQLKF